jgi:hypothetical protein
VLLPPTGIRLTPTAPCRPWRKRPPGGYPTCLLPGRGVVDDARETSSQLYCSRELSTGLIGLADGGSVGFGHDIHAEQGGAPDDRRQATLIWRGRRSLLFPFRSRDSLLRCIHRHSAANSASPTGRTVAWSCTAAAGSRSTRCAGSSGTTETRRSSNFWPSCGAGGVVGPLPRSISALAIASTPWAPAGLGDRAGARTSLSGEPDFQHFGRMIRRLTI